jgi:8-oxo-dGTP pyrophosphatase MutT (NUDIX family)
VTIEDLRQQIQRIAPVDAREEVSIEMTLERLAWPGDPYAESEHDHHVTASAFVVSSRGVILHRHRRLGIWVQPGGHVDHGETPEVACVRETTEETGLLVRQLDPVELFHVDVHPGPKGHTHYDLRYLLASEASDPRPPEGESPEVFWFDFSLAPERAEPTLAAALRKLAESIDSFGVRDLVRERN